MAIGTSFPAAKRLRCEANYTQPSSTKIKWSYTSTAPYLHDVQKDSFTFIS